MSSSIGKSSSVLSTLNVLDLFSVGDQDSAKIKAIQYGTTSLIPNNGKPISTVAYQNVIIPGISIGDLFIAEVGGPGKAYVGIERYYVTSDNLVTFVWRNYHNSSSATDNLTYSDGTQKSIRYIYFDLT